MVTPPLFRPVFQAATLRVTDTVITLDGVSVPAQRGESLITTLLVAGVMTGCNEFDASPRCGFCLMGACQDCTLWTDSGDRLRACMTVVQAGMVLRRQPPLEPPIGLGAVVTR